MSFAMIVVWKMFKWLLIVPVCFTILWIYFGLKKWQLKYAGITLFLKLVALAAFLEVVSSAMSSGFQNQHDFIWFMSPVHGYGIIFTILAAASIYCLVSLRFFIQQMCALKNVVGIKAKFQKALLLTKNPKWLAKKYEKERLIIESKIHYQINK